MAKQNIDIEVRGVDRGASSLLDGIAAKAKKLRREDALTGEKALGGFLNKGAGGLGELGLSAIGLGAAGLVADFATRSAAAFTDTLVTQFKDVALASKPFATQLKLIGGAIASSAGEAAKAIPILGGVARTLSNIVDLAMGNTSGESASMADWQRRQAERNRATGIISGIDDLLKGGGRSTHDALLRASQPDRVADSRIAREKLNDELLELQKQIDAAKSLDAQFNTAKFTRINQLEGLMRDKRAAAQFEEAKQATEFWRRQAEKTQAMQADAGRAYLGRFGYSADIELHDIRDRRRQGLQDLARDTIIPDAMRAQREKAIRDTERDSTIAARIESSRNREKAREQILDLQQQIRSITNPDTDYNVHKEAAIGGRFNTGQSELMLMRTANTDTARNTQEMLRELKKLNDQIVELKQVIDQNTEHPDAYSGGGNY